jgi:DNA polymerase-3 subunit beta
MKVNSQKEDLLYAVQAVSKAISNKNTLPILGGIMMEAKENNLIFRTTDLELAIECTINADVVEEGALVVPGRYFTDLVRYLPAGNIFLNSEDGQKLTVGYDQSEISVLCFDPEEFPALPEADGEIHGQIPVQVFKRLVRQVSIAAAADEVRPIFTGIYVKLASNQLIMVATDTHRLAIGEGYWSGQGTETLILPNRTLQEIARLAVNIEEQVLITANKNQAYFCLGNITFTSRVISGQYPDYKQVLPAESLYISKASMNKQRMIDALERAVLLSRDQSRGKGNVVKLNWQNTCLYLSADVPDVGKINEEIAAQIEGEEITASYNAKYLLEALKVIDSENVVIHLTGATTPGIIVPEGESREESSYIYLILPVRVSK